MKLVLIADSYPPLRSSGAVQLRDLAREFERQGHHLTVLIPAPDQAQIWRTESNGNIDVIRLKSPKTKDVNYARRTLNEFAMPFVMARNFRMSPAGLRKFDGVIWYSPSIFFGPLVKRLRAGSNCPSYLILRDIFPEWAADMGLMGRGMLYRLFSAVADFQYSVADVIGVQTPGNIALLTKESSKINGKVEVLHNWLTKTPHLRCSIQVNATPLAGRKIFVYAGNMGVAQGMSILLDLAAELTVRQDIGFIFVGRGSNVELLRTSAESRHLKNVLFFDEIDPDEIADLYAQCSAGLVALDPRHRTHNIPGKFLSYLQSGLPVLATVNAGNDLVDVIHDNEVGFVSTNPSVTDLARLACKLADDVTRNPEIGENCKKLAAQMFSSEAAVKQIVNALQVAGNELTFQTSIHTQNNTDGSIANTR